MNDKDERIARLLRTVAKVEVPGAQSDGFNILIRIAQSVVDSGEQIARLGSDIARTTKRVSDTIEAGGLINGLGELQTQALMYDRECALREDRIKTLKLAGAMYRHMAGQE